MSDIKRALDLWIEITGYDPSSNRIGNWELYKVNEELKESLELDPTNILTMLLLDYFTEQYLNQRSFSVNSIIADFDALTSYLAKSKELYSILRTDEIKQLREDFEAHTLLSLQSYGELPDAVVNTVKNSHDIAFLRRDALKSAETLTIAQFAHGEPDNEMPKFLENVYEYWNINSLIQMSLATNQSHISLALIRDPDYYNSYFVFVIKNGGTLSIVCDKPNWVHPLQKCMVRRPERKFADRAFMHHFPYFLMDLEYDEDQRGLYLRAKGDSKDVVPFQKDIHKLKKIKELSPHETIWITMMFQLILEKFWRKDYRTKEITYTGEMVTINHDRGKELVLPHRLVVPAFRNEDVRPETTKDQWRIRPTGQHDWLEKRYESQIPDEILTLTGVGDGVVKYITDKDMTNIQVTTDKKLEEEKWMASWEKETKHMLVGISPTEFGTKDQLVRDIQWNARYNKARAVRMLADQEYEKRRDEVLEWYKKAVEANDEFLLKAVALGKLEAWGGGSIMGFGVNPDEMENVLRFSEEEFSYSLKCAILHGGLDNHFRCYVNYSIASIAAEFRPTTAHGIATICGCRVSDLPDVIQNWRRHDLYAGNSILDRVDPMEWVVKDPWQKLAFDARIYLSIRGYTKLCKQYGTEPKARRYFKTQAEKEKWLNEPITKKSS